MPLFSVTPHRYFKMTKVKICGITNLEDALAALFCGADALGFVFYKKSPRFIAPVKARNISRILPKKILKVGVFVNEHPAEVKKIARLCRLDMLQFHGNETAEYCAKFKSYKVIKAFPVAKSIDLVRVLEYKVYAYLFDAFSKKGFGGSGKKFNWNLLNNIDRIKLPVFLSGGLSCANVSRAVKQLNPDWVDVSTSLELRPGKKNHKRINSFIRRVKEIKK
jgi:phosphoribosylanthranilate isomerase